MTDATAETTDEIDENQTSAVTSRRRLLKKGLATAGAIVVGVGATGSAVGVESGRFKTSPGRGGESVLPAEDYFPDKSFVITERTGEDRYTIDGALFECNEGDGEQIFLVGWHFVYEKEEEERTLYTRSNNIETGLEYSWGGNEAKTCEDSGQVVPAGQLNPEPPEDFVQTPYSANGRQ